VRGNDPHELMLTGRRVRKTSADTSRGSGDVRCCGPKEGKSERAVMGDSLLPLYALKEGN